MGAGTGTARLRRIQITTLALLVATGMLNYIDRATLSVANPLIRSDLGLDVADMGLLLSAFLWPYAFAQLPAGALIDILRPRLTLTAGVFCWSIAQVLGGLVTGFYQFIGARALLGLGEAPNYPVCARITRDWFNVRQRGTATGIWNSSSTLGTAVSIPLLTGIMLITGWRWMFIIMGAVGIVLSLLFYITYRNVQEADLTADELAFLGVGNSQKTAAKVTFNNWRQLFAYRTTWGVVGGFFGCVYGTWLYTAWLPGYLEIDRHFTIAKTGWVGAIPYAFGVVGSGFGGWLVDFLARHGVAPVKARKYSMTAALILTALFTTIAAETPNDTLAIACISVSLFMLYVCSTATWAMAPVVAPAALTASLGAIQNCGGYIGGALAPTITGFIQRAYGSFTPALLVAAGIMVTAAVICFVLVTGPIPDVQEAADESRNDTPAPTLI
ncbi:MFS transporter [Methylovirgula sp. 4M-Z18]|uniref:MFS transporter n=1 Tax=Methylovirgula sp. 4M-Z18 TaxID=2293567 RepID=UPI000E2EDEF0|nr:MFS transporter [Methylovirgula sp. 4M-Z18]RFB80248.1 MFS transporter [Methylovirgula sp. 4M-Z18]